jgi:hypothetical protein
MLPRDLTGQRLAALAVLGWLLLTPPLLALVDHPGRVLGVPVLYAWMFGVWALLILAMAVIVERRGDTPPDGPEA